MNFVFPSRWRCLLAGMLTAALFLSQSQAALLPPANLFCDLRENPRGIETAHPRLSWTGASSERGDFQTAFQVIAASSPELLASNTGDLWDSGKVESSEQRALYAGAPLHPSQQVYWKVRQWGKGGDVSEWSPIATWTMGILDPAEWSAQWIMGLPRKSIGYHSQTSSTANTAKWVQVDLGSSRSIDSIVLHPKWHEGQPGYGFPVRYRVEVSNDPTFASATTVDDRTAADVPNPGAFPVAIAVDGVSGRYVRVTATRLYRNAAGNNFAFALSQLEVVSDGTNVAQNAGVAALDTIQQFGWGTAGLTDGAGFVGCDYGRRLRREFTVKPGLKRATAHVCGLGQYEMFVNGSKNGADYLSPGWSAYRKTCLYDTRDLTGQLQEGPNAIGLILGNSMYQIGPGYGRYVKFQQSFGPLKAIVQIELEYEDGSTETVVSDSSWQTGSGAITFENLYAGEDYDARLETPGWSEPGFSDPRWTPAVTTTGPGGVLRGTNYAASPLGRFDVFDPIKVTPISANTKVYDMGQNASLMPKLKVRGPAGSYVRIIPAESVGPDGRVDRSSVTQDSNPPLPAWWQYTLAGDGTESWTPQFYYHSSRYFQVEVFPAPGDSELPTVESIQSEVVHSTARAVGTFQCSNPLFNQIYDLIRWAQRSNMMSLFTDCPGRERLGWLEQVHLNGPSLRYNFDIAAMFSKVQNDMADSQLDNGFVPNIAPEYFMASSDINAPIRNSPPWGSTSILGAWQQYQFHGDRQLLERYYPMMKAYLGFLTNTSDNFITPVDLGDWADLGQSESEQQLTSRGLVGTAVFYEDALAMAKIADLLGQPADAANFTQLAANIRTSFNNRFFKPATGTYDTNSQAANAMPLALGIVNPANVGSVTASLIADIRSNNNGLTTGEVAHVYMLRALQAAGRADLIYAMTNQTETPGYGFQIAQGATSLAERWDGQSVILWGSLNHFMQGHIMEWFYRHLAGIQLDPDDVAFRKIIIQPSIVGDLASASARYESTQGLIRSEWKVEGNQLTMNVSIPFGATAKIYVPTRSVDSVLEGGVPAENAAGVTFVGTEGEYAVWAVGSGDYIFTSSLGLAAPTITGGETTKTTATVEWTPVSGATAYVVKRAANPGGPFVTIADDVTAASFTDRNLATETTYHYVVAAKDGSRVSNDSDEIALTTSFLSDAGFESPIIATFVYDAPNSEWDFSPKQGNSGSGLSRNGSAFNNPAAPDGRQVAFVQGTGSMAQTLTELIPGVTYDVTFSAAQRAGVINGGQTWKVVLDGATLGNFAPGAAATAFADYTVSFTATAPSQILGFIGTNANGGDNTVFIDRIRVVSRPVETTVTYAGNRKVYLLWKPVSGATGYVIRRALSNDGPWTVVANVPTPAFTDTDVVNGVDYFYTIAGRIGETETPPSAVATASPNAVSVPIPNRGFENPPFGAGGFGYGIRGAGWKFRPNSASSGSGVASNGSGFTSSNPNAPEGTQVAFLQRAGVLSQRVRGFAPGGVYTLTFSSANRATAGFATKQSWDVTLDGTVIASYTNKPTTYSEDSSTFTASAAQHELAFVGKGSVDTTAFLDDLRLEGALPSESTSVTATGAGPDRIGISWSPISVATGYVVKRGESEGGSYRQIAVVDDTRYVDSDGLVSATTYFYKVSVLNAVGRGTASLVAPATTWMSLDAWRVLHFGTSENAGDAADDADPDGDGSPNRGEWVAGTDPNARSSVLEIREVVATADDITVRFPTVNGRAYRVERSGTLLGGSWTTVQRDVAGTGGIVEIKDLVVAPEGRCFYRVVVEQ